jgi:hypothetical protein
LLIDSFSQLGIYNDTVPFRPLRYYCPRQRPLIPERRVVGPGFVTRQSRESGIVAIAWWYRGILNISVFSLQCFDQDLLYLDITETPSKPNRCDTLGVHQISANMPCDKQTNGSLVLYAHCCVHGRIAREGIHELRIGILVEEGGNRCSGAAGTPSCRGGPKQRRFTGERLVNVRVRPMFQESLDKH